MGTIDVSPTILNDDSGAPKLLPSPFQSFDVLQNSISKTTTHSNTENHLCGYRSTFNINQQKQSYQQYKQEQYEQRLNFQHDAQEPHSSKFDSHNVDNNHNQNFRKNNQYHGTKPMGGYCKLCDRSFKTEQQLQKHIREHEKCCYDGCNFEGHMTLLKKHIEMQHNSELFQRMTNVETDEDIEKWREERRKRYPTKANIETRQLAQEERFKRGERLSEPKNRFGKINNERNDRKNIGYQKHDGNRPTNNRNAAQKKKRNKKQRNNRNNNKNDKSDEAQTNIDVETAINNEKVIRFTGISQLDDRQEVKAQPEVQTNALTALFGQYGSDSDDENDANVDEVTIDTHLNETEILNEEPVKELEQSNAVVPVATEIKEFKESDLKEIQDENIKTDVQVTVNASQLECNSDDEPPEEQLITHVNTEADAEYSKSMNQERNRKRIAETKSDAVPVKKIFKKTTIFDMTKKIRSQNSLLEKLLQKDIRHERNVLLQCVRYVVEQNFFGIGQSEPAKP